MQKMENKMVSKTVKLTENQEKELLDIAEANLGDRNFSAYVKWSIGKLKNVKP